MAWRLRYKWSIEWLGHGTAQLNEGASGAYPDMSSGAQSLTQFNTAGGQVVNGHGAAQGAGGGLFDATDITTVTNAAAADMVTQLTAKLGQIQGFATGSG